MKCNCDKITPQSQECYDQMITVRIPDHMSQYRENRVKAGLSDMISIDPCIYPEIEYLWKHGIITYGCCCGHKGQGSPFVNVDDSNIDRMLELGYKQEHWDESRKDTFRLKTANKIKFLRVADVRKRMDAAYREEISYTRAVELLNEDVLRAIESEGFSLLSYDGGKEN